MMSTLIVCRNPSVRHDWFFILGLSPIGWELDYCGAKIEQPEVEFKGILRSRKHFDRS